MSLRYELDPEPTPGLRAAVLHCWVEATNAGGSVGFVAPVDADAVRPVADAAFASTVRGGGTDHMLVAYDEDDALVGWLLYVHPHNPLAEHWRTLKRVMVDPKFQGCGHGLALLAEAERVARERGWRALHLTVRGGQGLEGFYGQAGYREVGRLPGALRIGPEDYRDEVSMHLALV